MHARIVAWRRVVAHVGATATAAAASVAQRHYSEARTSFSGATAPAWGSSSSSDGSCSDHARDVQPSYPSALADFPLSQPRMRKTHIEWKLHHGHGVRYGQYGPTRDLADYEYADGTPACLGLRRFAYKHHQDHLLVQLIRAGALVEQHEAEGTLPRVPGTREQRDWDPAIPLFLDDLDEHGQPPQPVDTTSATTAATTAAASSDDTTAASASLREMTTSRVTDEHFARAHATPPSHMANAHAGETLTPNTMFASYDPAAFVDDTVRLRDERRPHWSRLRWALNDNFLVPKDMQAKNTIKDD